MDFDRLAVVCGTVLVLSFLYFLSGLATLSTNSSTEKFNLCINAGHSWQHGSCIVSKDK